MAKLRGLFSSVVDKFGALVPGSKVPGSGVPGTKMAALLATLYAVYVYAVYHWLVLPAFAEWSAYAVLLAPALAAVALLVPREARRRWVVLTLLVVLADEAFRRVIGMGAFAAIVSTVLVAAVVGGVGAVYGRVRPMWMVLVLAVTLLANVVFPDGKVEMYSHFTLKDSTDQTYFGEFTQPFPFTVTDLDGDGLDEIVTIGNGEGTRSPSTLTEFIQETYKNETRSHAVRQYVFGVHNGKFGDLSGVAFDTAALKRSLPRYYTGGFPYYLLDLSSMTMKKVVSSDLLTATLMRTGYAPSTMYALDMAWLANQITDNAGIWDSKVETGSFAKVWISGGKVSGVMKNGATFSMPTSSTRIIGAMRVEGGREALVLQGTKVEIVDPVKGELLYALDKYAKAGIGKSDLSIADLNGNGVDELIVHYPQPMILEPAGNDKFTVLYGSLSDKFKLADVRDGKIVAFDRSLVRNTETLYVGGFTYGDGALHQDWKVFLPNVSQATWAQMDGDKELELVTTFQGEHRIYVWEPHGVPVRWLLLVVTALLLGYVGWRRLRDREVA